MVLKNNDLKLATIKKTILFILVILSVLFNGCEDFLQEEPASLIELKDFDAPMIENLIIGMYEPLTRSRGRLWESNWGRALMLLEEHTISRYGQNNSVANYRFKVRRDLFDLGWPTIYESISRANYLLKILEQDNGLSDEVVTQAVGEASFVRAFAYYQLVRIFGKVPMRLELLDNTNNVATPFAEIYEIYEQIISDLKVAESTLPAKTSNLGRATAGAAKTALADVYLTLGMYEDSKAKALEVIENRSAYNYALIASFELLYSPISATNNEDIFSLKFSRFLAQGSFLAAYAAPNSHWEVAAARGFEDFGANTNAPILRDWDNNDLRKTLNIYNTAIINGDTVDIPMAGAYTHVYGKHRDPGAPGETAAGVDYYMYRYADILLIFAEAENHINGPTLVAYNAINKIRRRAYGLNINLESMQADLPQGLSQKEFEDMVFRERGYEFMFEGKRWFDLKRTGKWKTIIPEAGKDLPTDLFWPLPADEILYNDEIE